MLTKTTLFDGVTDIVVVTGFRTERVEDHALQLYRETGARIRTVFNPFFQVADNLGTCWIVREEMDRDFIILNGDTIVSDEIVGRLIAGAQDAITVAHLQDCEREIDAMLERKK